MHWEGDRGGISVEARRRAVGTADRTPVWGRASGGGLGVGWGLLAATDVPRAKSPPPAAAARRRRRRETPVAGLLGPGGPARRTARRQGGLVCGLGGREARGGEERRDSLLARRRERREGRRTRARARRRRPFSLSHLALLRRAADSADGCASNIVLVKGPPPRRRTGTGRRSRPLPRDLPVAPPLEGDYPTTACAAAPIPTGHASPDFPTDRAPPR